MSVLGEIIGGAFSIGTTAMNNRMAAEREREAREENYKYNEMAANNSDLRQRALMEDYYTPSAQIAQLKQAGLSPSVMYGGDGSSGQTTAAQGAGTSGISPNVFGLDPMALSQIKLNEAQARKLQTEADKNEGKNAMGDAEVKQKLASAGLNEAETAYTKVKTETSKLIQCATVQEAEYRSDIARNEAEKGLYEIISKKAQSEIDAATVQANIDRINKENELLDAETLLKKSNIKLNDEQVKFMKEQVKIWQEQNLQKWQALILEQNRTETYGEFIKNLNDYQDESIKVLRERLGQEQGIFNDTNKREWSKLIYTMINDQISRIFTAIAMAI